MALNGWQNLIGAALVVAAIGAFVPLVFALVWSFWGGAVVGLVLAVAGFLVIGHMQAAFNQGGEINAGGLGSRLSMLGLLAVGAIIGAGVGAAVRTGLGKLL